MVEYTAGVSLGGGREGYASLDGIFAALSDMTRRDILRRVAVYRLSVSEIAKPYDLTIAAISKHLKVLEHAGFITKRRIGRKHYIYPATTAFKDAAQWLEFYKSFWESNLDSLKNYTEGGQDG